MRKSIEYAVDSGADKGKIFVITRMSAFEADKWANRTVKALAEAQGRVTPQSEKNAAGIAGLAGFSFNLFGALANKDREEAYESLMRCCQIKRDPKNPLVEPTKILDIDIEDPMTFVHLRTKAFELHVDFLKAAVFQIFPLTAALLGGEAEREEA